MTIGSDALASYAPFLALGLFLGVLALLEAGRLLGARRRARGLAGENDGAGAVEGAVFALLGLLIAFTFSGAAARFDDRRQQITEEANAIGTAWLRIDLLPAASQAPMRGLFRQYLDSRLATYQKLRESMEAALNEAARSNELQGQIWTSAVTASRESSNTVAAMLLLQALNAMIDITTTRFAASRMHPPAIVYVMLVIVTLISAVLAGYGMAAANSRSWLHVIGYAIVIAATVYVILDLEYPRLGFIRIDSADQLLIDLRRGMN